MRASERRDDNLEVAERLVDRAASLGAELVVLPEKWNAYGSEEALVDAAEELNDGPSVHAMRGWARRHGVIIVGGSITERRPNRDRFSNTCVVVDQQGELRAIYRKIHLFDVDVDGDAYRESDLEEPGDAPATCDLDDWRVGLTICYDLRFPELYRLLTLAGSHLITVPAAFTVHTGRDHWEILLRARAVENQSFVAAAGQWGTDRSGRATYGRSMIVDAWGVVLAQAPDRDGVIVADLERQHLRRIRATLPSLANRQPDAYTTPVLV
jgi:deaminated glutathione amidase